MNASENPTIFTPFSAASEMMAHVFLTEACRSSHSGSYWAAATRSVDAGGAELPIFPVGAGCSVEEASNLLLDLMVRSLYVPDLAVVKSTRRMDAS